MKRSYVDVDAVELAEKNNITIMLLPAHTSHELQPLDKAVFKSLKSCFYNNSRTWHNHNPGRTLNKLSFHQVFTTSWIKACSIENALVGFRTCGIHLYNPHIISDFAFAPSAVSEMPVPVDPHASSQGQDPTPTDHPMPIQTLPTEQATTSRLGAKPLHDPTAVLDPTPGTPTHDPPSPIPHSSLHVSLTSLTKPL